MKCTSGNVCPNCKQNTSKIEGMCCIDCIETAMEMLDEEMISDHIKELQTKIEKDNKMSAIETVKNELTKRNLTQKQCAEMICTTTNNLNAILCGKSKFTVSMAIRVERSLGIKAEDLLHQQIDEELRKERERINGRKN